jgi:phospholipase/lecithinase/hemolysin
MRKFFLLAGLVLVTLLTVTTVRSSGGIGRGSEGIARLYVFGDSLSDTGNVYRATGKQNPPDPPYFQGRFSNGPVWVERLAEKLGIHRDRITNLAWGGATTGNDEKVPSLLTQTREFVAKDRAIDPNALAIVWIGGNDYLRGTTNPAIPLKNLSTALYFLARSGVRNFLVVNLPDLGQVPGTLGGESSRSIGVAIEAHNRGLGGVIDRLKRDFGNKIRVVEFDTYSLYKEAISAPDRFGFENVRSACFDRGAICPNPDRFLFWDGIHPSEAAHRVLGDSAYQVVKREFSGKIPGGDR